MSNVRRIFIATLVVVMTAFLSTNSFAGCRSCGHGSSGCGSCMGGGYGSPFMGGCSSCGSFNSFGGCNSCEQNNGCSSCSSSGCRPTESARTSNQPQEISFSGSALEPRIQSLEQKVSDLDVEIKGISKLIKEIREQRGLLSKEAK